MTVKKNPVDGLSRFEGQDVLRSTIVVKKAGDGLSEAVSVDPSEYHRGDRVYVVLETTVGAIAYKGMPKTDGAVQRVHELITEHAAIVDGQAVAELLAETKKAVALKKERDEEAAGIQKVPGTRLADEQDNDGSE